MMTLICIGILLHLEILSAMGIKAESLRQKFVKKKEVSRYIPVGEY